MRPLDSDWYWTKKLSALLFGAMLIGLALRIWPYTASAESVTLLGLAIWTMGILGAIICALVVRPFVQALLSEVTPRP